MSNQPQGCQALETSVAGAGVGRELGGGERQGRGLREPVEGSRGLSLGKVLSGCVEGRGGEGK